MKRNEREQGKREEERRKDRWKEKEGSNIRKERMRKRQWDRNRRERMETIIKEKKGKGGRERRKIKNVESQSLSDFSYCILAGYNKNSLKREGKFQI